MTVKSRQDLLEWSSLIPTLSSGSEVPAWILTLIPSNHHISPFLFIKIKMEHIFLLQFSIIYINLKWLLDVGCDLWEWECEGREGGETRGIISDIMTTLLLLQPVIKTHGGATQPPPPPRRKLWLISSPAWPGLLRNFKLKSPPCSLRMNECQADFLQR